ncbi:SRPBCC domain-containing protein [Chromobacterium violaceum]|uniref:Polyketide cyclase / dehydrase and lipid transport n=1 Tax=Chromobacterium violaceum TaxID=536 RepID=A0AAX2MBM7_CHRVL|nr:SRPBCC domain-containing protein [Chromobacterium violaceum]OLZ84449.1 polyketide cyclase [Chromobacterium violaceum]STB71148.1 Polyketide cyclase / dehydrase and lipid transport [Chromobacterium violaceum]SUX33286.1 Polyketide cyclase / dehydrase and lipid transport [Chromobacterium violaceum]
MATTRSIATEIDIAASLEQVWQVLTDWRRYPEWNPFIVGLHGRHEAGARLVATLHPPGGRHTTFRPRLTAFDVQTRLAWRGKLLVPGLLDGAHHFQLEPLDGGGTRLHHGEDFSGILLPLCGDGMLERARQGILQMNQTLKRRCEALASQASA